MYKRQILDTGVLIAAERSRLPLSSVIGPDDDVAIASVTLAELWAGVDLAASTQQPGPRAAFVEALTKGPEALPGMILNISGLNGDVATRWRAFVLCEGTSSRTCIPELDAKFAQYEASVDLDETALGTDANTVAAWGLRLVCGLRDGSLGPQPRADRVVEVGARLDELLDRVRRHTDRRAGE